MALTVSLSLWLYDPDEHKATSRITVYLSLSALLAVWSVLVKLYRQWALCHYVLIVGFPVVVGTASMSAMYALRVEDHAAPWTYGPAAIILVLFFAAAFTRLPVSLLTSIAAANCAVYIYGIVRISEPLFPASTYLALTVVGVWALSRDIERRERTVFSQLAYVASASTAKSRVLASVSHDLRQPLGALGLYLGLFEAPDKALSLEAVRVNSMRMRMCIQAMEGNLSRLLEIGRLQSTCHRTNVGSTDVAELLSRLQSVYSLQAATSNITLEFSPVSLAARWAESNETSLFEVLSNLVHNALKFTHLCHVRAGGRVIVRAHSSGRTVEIQVADNGPGIASSDQARIFDEYVQLSNSERDHRKGYGLGLAIVRQIIDSLPGHQVKVESSLGAGCSFTISLPAIAAPPDCVRSTSRFREGYDAAGMTGRLVLVVEDDILMRDALAETLRSWGIEVEVAATIDAALAVVEGSDVLHDVILTDWRLPDESTGIQVIDSVRRVASVDVPAVIITGEFLDEDAASMLPSDITLLRKPLADTEFRCALRDAFVRSDALRRRVAHVG